MGKTSKDPVQAEAKAVAKKERKALAELAPRRTSGRHLSDVSYKEKRLNGKMRNCEGESVNTTYDPPAAQEAVLPDPYVDSLLIDPLKGALADRGLDTTGDIRAMRRRLLRAVLKEDVEMTEAAESPPSSPIYGAASDHPHLFASALSKPSSKATAPSAQSPSSAQSPPFADSSSATATGTNDDALCFDSRVVRRVTFDTNTTKPATARKQAATREVLELQDDEDDCDSKLYHADLQRLLKTNLRKAIVDSSDSDDGSSDEAPSDVDDEYYQHIAPYGNSGFGGDGSSDDDSDITSAVPPSRPSRAASRKAVVYDETSDVEDEESLATIDTDTDADTDDDDDELDDSFFVEESPENAKSKAKSKTKRKAHSSNAVSGETAKSKKRKSPPSSSLDLDAIVDEVVEGKRDLDLEDDTGEHADVNIEDMDADPGVGMEVVPSNNDAYDGEVLGDGRCFPRSFLAALMRQGQQLEFGGVAVPTTIDFRNDSADATLQMLNRAHHAYADALLDHYLSLPVGGDERMVLDTIGDAPVEQWHLQQRDINFAASATVSRQHWADERLIMGGALFHQANVQIFRPDQRVALPDNTPVVPVRDDWPEVIIAHHVGANGEGIHFDLQTNPAFVDYDELLWPLESCPFPLAEGSVNFFRGLIDTWDGDRMSHLSGATRMVPRHLLRTDESLQRILRRYPIEWQEMMMRPGFRPELMNRQDWECIQEGGRGILDPTKPGGGYVRVDCRPIDDKRADYEKCSNSTDIYRRDDGRDVAITGFRLMGRFIDKFSETHQDLPGTSYHSTIYGGETSTGTVEDRWEAESNPNVRDGAGGQWEYFQLFELTHQFMVFFVSSVGRQKFQSWLLEAFFLGTMCLSGKKNGGSANLLLGVDGTGLNSTNGGVPFFLDFGTATKLAIVKWFKGGAMTLDRDQPIMSNLDVPPGITGYVLFHYRTGELLDYLRKKCDSPQLVLADVTIRMAHQFLSHRGAEKAFASVHRVQKLGWKGEKLNDDDKATFAPIKDNLDNFHGILKREKAGDKLTEEEQDLIERRCRHGVRGIIVLPPERQVMGECPNCRKNHDEAEGKTKPEIRTRVMKYGILTANIPKAEGAAARIVLVTNQATNETQYCNITDCKKALGMKEARVNEICDASKSGGIYEASARRLSSTGSRRPECHIQWAEPPEHTLYCGNYECPLCQHTAGLVPVGMGERERQLKSISVAKLRDRLKPATEKRSVKQKKAKSKTATKAKSKTASKKKKSNKKI